MSIRAIAGNAMLASMLVFVGQATAAPLKTDAAKSSVSAVF